jgi:putative endonuclease
VWLEKNGFEILAHNWRHGRYELDLIAREGQTVAFIEVKTRRLGPGGPPSCAVDALKRKRIARAAAAWIATHPADGDEFRFDLIEVVDAPGEDPLVDLIRNAFQADNG